MEEQEERKWRHVFDYVAVRIFHLEVERDIMNGLIIVLKIQASQIAHMRICGEFFE